MLRAQFIKIMLAGLAVALIVMVWRVAPPSAAPGTRRPAPDIALPMEINGPPVPLSALRGNVVVLDFWATWCAPCRMSMPDLEALYKKYGKQGLKVVGVSRDHSESRGQIPAVLQQLQITYPIVVADDVANINEHYGVDSLPTLLVIDRRGEVAFVQTGYHAPQELESQIVALLQESP